MMKFLPAGVFWRRPVRRLDTVFRDIRVARPTFIFPSVNPNSTVSIDLTVVGIEVGTHIISWIPVDDARAFDDLVIQWMCVNTDLVRVTMLNPTGMMISPGTLDCVFVLGVMKEGVIATVTIDDFP